MNHSLRFSDNSKNYFRIRSNSLKLIFPLLGYKLFIFAFVFLSVKLLPGMFSNAGYYQNFHWPPEGKPGFSSMFQTWDGQIFLFLSRMGYQQGSITTVAYPLWPWLIRIVSQAAGGHSLTVGLLLANILSLLGLLLFHHLISCDFSEPLADRALLLLLAFPGALFFSFVYSESLFLILSILFFIFLRQSKYGPVSAIAFLMTLTRSVGIFCLFPLMWDLASKKEKPIKWLFCLGPLLGLAVYFWIVYRAMGNPLAGFEIQKRFIAHASIGKLLDFSVFFKTYFSFPLQIHGMLNSAIDRLWFLWFTASMIFVWKRNKTYFIYALAMGFVPAVTVSLMSYTRYLLLVFPVFVVTAEIFLKESRKGWLWLTLAVLFFIQIIFLLRHVNNYWVA